MNEKLKSVVDRATDYSGSTGRKVSKGLLGGIIVLLLGALGLEMSSNDWDLGKLFGGASMSESKIERDASGNILRDKEGNIVTSGGKRVDEYNCDDFSTQPEAQRFFERVGGIKADTNRLDGNKDGVACQDLPKGK